MADMYGQSSVSATAPQMEQEVLNMQDSVRRAKAAQIAATQNNQGVAMNGAPGPMVQAHDLVAGGVIHASQKAADPDDPQTHIDDLNKRAGKLEAEAELIGKGKTPNPGAQQTYLRAASLVRQQAHQVHAQWMASLAQQAQQAAQQGGQPMTPVVR